MSEVPQKNPRIESIDQQAAAWVLRCDRGLTAAEQDEFSQWLADDPRHGAQLARHRRYWRRLDKLVQWCPEHSVQPNPDLLAPPLRHRFRRVLPITATLAAAAAIAVGLIAWMPTALEPSEHSPMAIGASPEGQRVLEDGSVIELNRGAVVRIQFTSGERRVRLEQGEAHFAVKKDPSRPFIVTARGLNVRAVGTAFNVRLDTAVVEVLVTEGSVQVDSPDTRGPATPLVPLLEANQRAVLSLATNFALPQIATLTPGEIQRVLSWQHRLLNFTATSLSDIVAEFNRRNVVQMVVIDPELASVRISASFRSDNIEGFIRLLEAGFDARAEPRGQSEILLRKAR